MAFCRRQRLPPSKAEAVAERLEFLTRRLPAKGSENVKAKAKAKARRGVCDVLSVLSYAKLH